MYFVGFFLKFYLLDVSLWEIVSEILSMTINPENPFELDFCYIDALPLEEAVLLTGGLVVFLENIWVQADPSIIFVNKGKVSEFISLKKNASDLIKIS